MRLRSGVASDLGLVRQSNEDSYLTRNGLYVICDGMGGARGGEVASEMACGGLRGVDPATAGPEELRSAIREVNLAIVARSLDEHRLMGMGTTLTAVLAQKGLGMQQAAGEPLTEGTQSAGAVPGGSAVVIAHVGDSRAYLFGDGRLTQVTDDHSWVGEMVRRGEMTPAQAAVHPHRSVITRALGTDGEVQPDFFEVEVKPGDRLLLCTDGLTGMITDPEIAAILGRGEGPQAAAEQLVEAAVSGGGEDNVTVIVIDVEAEDDEPGDGAPGAEAQAGAPPGAADADDLIITGPADRGSLSPSGQRRGRRQISGVRERLGGRVGPLLRPVNARRPGGGESRGASGRPGPEAAAQGDGAPGDPEAGSGVPEGEAPGAPAPAVARRPTRRRWLVLALVVVVVVVIAIGGFAIFNSSVYYVGTSGDSVALFHGLPGSVFGIDLSSVIEEGTVAYSSLAPYMQVRVDTHDLVTKEEGQRFLRSLTVLQ